MADIRPEDLERRRDGRNIDSELGAVADAVGGERLKGLGQRCRWVGTVGSVVSSGLLIYDLGRPERFLNMMRVFRPTSPMNLGSWVLAGRGR